MKSLAVHFPPTSCYFLLQIFLSVALISITLSLCSSLVVSDQVWNPYKDHPLLWVSRFEIHTKIILVVSDQVWNPYKDHTLLWATRFEIHTKIIRYCEWPGLKSIQRSSLIVSDQVWNPYKYHPLLWVTRFEIHTKKWPKFYCCVC